MANELRNYLRGLNQDNSNNTHTGNTNETTLSSFSIPANEMGATGAVMAFAAGTITGANGTKTIRLKLGTTTITTITQAAGTTGDWFFLGYGANTTVSAQRWIVLKTTDDATTCDFDYGTSALDTSSSSRIFSCSVQLGNGADSVTQTMWDVFIVQVT